MRFGIEDASILGVGTGDAHDPFAKLCDIEAVLPPVSADPELADGALCLLVHSGCAASARPCSPLRRPRGRRGALAGPEP